MKGKVIYWLTIGVAAIVAVKVWDKFIAPRLGL